jgi:hypothetical protein
MLVLLTWQRSPCCCLLTPVRVQSRQQALTQTQTLAACSGALRSVCVLHCNTLTGAFPPAIKQLRSKMMNQVALYKKQLERQQLVAANVIPQSPKGNHQVATNHCHDKDNVVPLSAAAAAAAQPSFANSFQAHIGLLHMEQHLQCILQRFENSAKKVTGQVRTCEGRMMLRLTCVAYMLFLFSCFSHASRSLPGSLQAPLLLQHQRQLAC